MTIERLTNRLCREDVIEMLEKPLYKSQSETWLRLCDIEDILGDEYDLAHLRELIQADREGRCIILPVSLGERIFVRYKSGEFPVVVESVVVGAHIKDTESYRGAPRKEYIVVRSNGFSKHISVDQIGKTAFFSREEALAGKRTDLAKREES